MPTDVKELHRFNNILLGNGSRNGCVFLVHSALALSCRKHLPEKEEKSETFLPCEKKASDSSNDNYFYQLGLFL